MESKEKLENNNFSNFIDSIKEIIKLYFQELIN